MFNRAHVIVTVWSEVQQILHFQPEEASETKIFGMALKSVYLGSNILPGE